MRVDELRARVDMVTNAPMMTITTADREEMAVALVLQGYDLTRALRLAFDELEENDGALQMLARRAASARELGA